MKRVNRLSSPRSGFTLLELLIVLAILIVVIGMLGTTVWGQYRKALIRSATIQVTSKLHDALELFKVDQGRYPYATEGLYILANVDNPDPQGAQQKQDEAMAAARQEAGVNNMQGKVKAAILASEASTATRTAASVTAASATTRTVASAPADLAATKTEALATAASATTRTAASASVDLAAIKTAVWAATRTVALDRLVIRIRIISTTETVNSSNRNNNSSNSRFTLSRRLSSRTLRRKT